MMNDIFIPLGYLHHFGRLLSINSSLCLKMISSALGLCSDKYQQLDPPPTVYSLDGLSVPETTFDVN
jgi:hypothetical protein